MRLSHAALAVITGFSAWATAPASAEVIRSTASSFVSRHEVVVEASPKEVWLALISPAAWWTSEHTWSGDAKNLTLVPQAGGCFCETIPEVDEPGRFTLQGSVEHMRVVQAYPEQALRLVGSLGPLQSEPVTGVLTIAISTTPKGTRIVWEYNVGGPMRYEVPVISEAVDAVMAAQLAGLAKPLGVVALATPPPATGATPRGSEPAPSARGEGKTEDTHARGAAARKPVPPELDAATVVPPAKPGSAEGSVEDAFGDLTKQPSA